MANNFPTALLYTLKQEGGFVDNPSDHGGATNRGVTLKAYCAFRQAKGRPVPTVDDLRSLSVAETGEFYTWHDWEPQALAACNSPVIATVLFDIGVLNGVGTAGQAAQAVASGLTGQALIADGKLGPKSWAVINLCSESRFVRSIQRRQARRYLDLCLKDATQAQFFESWMARTFSYSDLLTPSALPSVA